MTKFIAALLFSLIFVSSLYADGAANSDWTDSPKEPSLPANPEVPEPNQASDASFDKRLPPVLPGERVNDSGREMKVWSSTGPVVVADEPEPWNDKKNDSLNVNSDNHGNLDVIIDRRGDK
ncbi:MAG: hypothetical protein KDD56_10095 [Bdellovibrionales bacterium]|nr:hypothetical protein [Bdellovibrionales bacterium]